MKPVLRKAINKDLMVTYDIQKTVYREYIEQIWGWDEKVQFDLHEERFNQSEIEIIEYNKSIAGWLEIKRESRQIHIVDICISPDYQSKGIGSYLLKQILLEGKNNKPIKLEVFKRNKSAQKFYKMFGFKQTGETETHYLMQKDC